MDSEKLRQKQEMVVINPNCVKIGLLSTVWEKVHSLTSPSFHILAIFSAKASLTALYCTNELDSYMAFVLGASGII